MLTKSFSHNEMSSCISFRCCHLVENVQKEHFQKKLKMFRAKSALCGQFFSPSPYDRKSSQSAWPYASKNTSVEETPPGGRRLRFVNPVLSCVYVELKKNVCAIFLLKEDEAGKDRE